MHLNIYYSKNLPQKNKFEEFFIDNFLFKEKEDYLAGELLNIFFYDIKDYKVEENSFDVILVDEFLINEVLNNEMINKQLKDKWKSNKKIQNIIFISLTENYDKLNISKEINFIQAYKKDNLNKLLEFIHTEITHDILRFLLQKERLNIFISHAKKDGVLIAKEIKKFIDASLKLSNFFDEVNISNSERWNEKIEKSLKDCDLFIYILSDNYAKTLWTKKELIFAKENNKPIIGIDILSDKTEISPFIANTKIFKLNQNIQQIEMNCSNTFLLKTQLNIRAIINFLLKEALIYKLEQKKGVNFPRKPDLFDLCKVNKDIVYPDPPIMKIEEEAIKQCAKNKFFTPLTKEMKEINKKIAISISEPSDLKEKGVRIEHLNLFMIEIARYLIIRNATLIYGGDLGYKKEKFNFTKILANTFKAYNRLTTEEKKLINYSAYPFCKNIDMKIKNSYSDVIKFKKCIGKESNFDDIETIANNLTEMRKQITKDMDIKIAVGGKITGFSGFYPGVLEEVYLALKNDKNVILVYGFGGIVDKIVEFIKGKEIKELTFKYQIDRNSNLEKFLKDKKNLIKKIEKKYNKMSKIVKEKNDLIKIVEFEGISESVRKCLNSIE